MRVNFKHEKVLEAPLKVFKKGYECELCNRKSCKDRGPYELDDIYVCQDCYENAVTKGV